VPLDFEGSSKVKNKVIAYSRKHYGTSKKAAEKYMDKLFEEKPKKQDVKKTKPTKNSQKRFGA
jgi:hypothetical protein